MKIPESGDKWLCIKTIELIDENENLTGDIVYIKGRIYRSENYGCITNEQGDRNHHWIDTDTSGYFIRIPRNKKFRNAYYQKS